MKKNALLISFLFFGTSLFSTPPSTGYILTYQDKFDSSAVNLNDWGYRVGARFDGYNQQKNVRIDSGLLKVDFKKELVVRTPTKPDTITFTGGGIISKKCFGYGYYEVKSKTFAATAGLHSSFWLIGSLGDGTTTPRVNTVLEIDGYEVDSHNPTGAASNFHNYVGKYSNIGGASNTNINTSTQYVTNGIEWMPTYIKWYTNGVCTRTYNNPPCYAAQNLWLTALGSSYFSNFAKVKTDSTKLPGYTSWEYFKYYAKDMSGCNWVGGNDFEYNNGTGFTTVWNLDLPMAWCENGATTASTIVKDSLGAHSGKYYLKHINASAYSVKTSQHLEYIPNGTYTFKAWMRSSGGQTTARMTATGMGTADSYVDIPALSAWTQMTLDNIVVTNNSCEIAFYSLAAANQWMDIDSVTFVQKTSAALPIVRDPGFDAAVNKTTTPTTNTWSSAIGTVANSYQTGSSSSIMSDIDGDNYFSCNMTANSVDPSKWYLSSLSQLTVDTIKAQNYQLRLRARTTNPSDSTYLQLKLSCTNSLGASVITAIQNNSPELTWVTESAASTAITSKQLRIKPTSSWKTYTANLTLTPTLATPARIYFMFPRAGTFDIDDVSLEVAPISTLTNNFETTKQDFCTVTTQRGMISIKVSNETSSSIELYNILGKLIHKNSFVGEYQSPAFGNGLYVVKVSNNGSVITKKISIGREHK